jgi:hypothetical protein
MYKTSAFEADRSEHCEAAGVAWEGLGWLVLRSADEKIGPPNHCGPSLGGTAAIGRCSDSKAVIVHGAL